jgi:hypothetical protein
LEVVEVAEELALVLVPTDLVEEVEEAGDVAQQIFFQQIHIQ